MKIPPVAQFSWTLKVAAFSLATSAFWLVALRAQGQLAPANDLFDNRISVTTTVFSFTTTNTFATNEMNEPPHRGLPPVRSLWWRWTAGSDGYALVTTSNSPSHTRVAVYDYGKVITDLHSNVNLNNSGLPITLDRYEFNAQQTNLYYNIAVDGRDGDSGVIQLDFKLYTRPEILVQPVVEVTVTAGQRTNLAVTALGKLPLTNQWQFSAPSSSPSFTNLPAGVNAQLPIGTSGVISKGDEGYYRAIIANGYGSVTSRVVQVTVNECAIPNPPTPSIIITNVGKTVSFTASALGTQPFSYQWQFRAAGQVDFGNIAGASATNLVLTNISTDQSGDYRFLVSNIACTNVPSASVILAVTTNNALVLDKTIPLDVTVITNQNAGFSARTIQGYQPIRYQWWFMPTSGPATNIDGETATNLFLAGVQVGQAGTYWVTASNRYAVDDSRHAQLKVEIRPPNDNFAARIPIFPDWASLPMTNQSTTTVFGSNKNATIEPGEPRHLGLTTNCSVWWSFTAPTNGQVIVELTAPNQLLAAYTGYYVDSLTRVINRSNWLDHFEFLGVAGTEYSFAVDSTNGIPSTSIGLKLTFNPTFAPTILCQPGDPCGVGDGGGVIGRSGGGLDVLGGGGGDGDEGCTNFSAYSVTATSIDGAVYYQWQFGSTTNGPFVNLPGRTNAMLVLQSVTITNQGWYRAAVSNSANGVVYTRAVLVNVILGPVITTTNGQPQSVTTNTCTSAQFKVTAMSCSPLGYQWRQNGVNVSAPNAFGANSATLLFTNLAPGNAGIYDVVIWNIHQSITSLVATLTLNTTPPVLAQPRSATNFACSPASFLFRANDNNNCPLTYQWFFQGGPIAGASTTTLNLTNVQPQDAGDYFAVGSTPYVSLTSQVAHLTVQTIPVITNQPITQTNVRPCDVVNLEVQVQGEPSCSPVSYQWKLAGTNLPPDTHPGSTSRTYSFDALAETAGDYQVVISNPWASVTSTVAHVAFDARPVISTQPAGSQKIREGDAFTNKVGVACGALALSYAWQFRPPSNTNYTDVALDAHHILTTNGWLIVQNAQTNESGYYRVLVSNIYSNTTSSAGFVRVVRPPPNDYFTNATSLGSSSPASATGYNEYATAEIPSGEKPHASQGPSHSVWWVWTNPYPSLVTVDLSGSDINTVLSVYTGTMLSNLVSIAEDDDGGPNHWSRVSFMAGQGQVLYLAVDGKSQAEGTNLVVSVTALPISGLAPFITIQPVNLARSAGQTVVFSLEAYGSPDITIQWFGKGSLLPGTTTNVAISTTTPALTNYVSTLTLNNVTTNDEGVYKAVLSNASGVVTSSIATLTFGSIVRGMVSDATKTVSNSIAVGIPGVLVSVGVVTNITNTNGDYELVGVQRGDLRAGFMANKTHVHLNEDIKLWNLSTETAALLTATKDGYYDYLDDQFEVGKGQSVAKYFSMSPIFSGLRFVMNWTNSPGDLDLYLHFPTNVPGPFAWIDSLYAGSSNGPPFATRDADMKLGFGPETISLHRFYSGTYSVYAAKYPGQGGHLAESSARVVAYMGGDVTNGLSTRIKPLAAVTVPASGTTNDWWYVCDIEGATTNITWVNQLLAAPPLGQQTKSAGADASRGKDVVAYRPKDSFPTNAVYEWNFGDNSALDTNAEPTHAYATVGWKTVSLRITPRVGSKSDTLIQTNYILVENAPPIIAITNPPGNMIVRAGDPITLQSTASGVDDPIQQVEYYLVDAQTNYLATTTNAPYAFPLPNDTLQDATNTFVARAIDQHGATAWSAPVSVRIADLRGEILLVRNAPAPVIDEMVNDLAGQAFIPLVGGGYRGPIVKVLDQEGLYYDLVRGFKLIIWNDHGSSNALTATTIGVLKQAYDGGTPLYLIGDALARSADSLRDTDFDHYLQWRSLVALSASGTNNPPLYIWGIKTASRDGLFRGWYGAAQVGTNLFYPDPVEFATPTVSNMDVVAMAASTRMPLMLRYPRFADPDFGQTRRLVQDFRVTSGSPAQSPEEQQSHDDRQVLFINGVTWLLGMFLPDDFCLCLDCQSAGDGAVGTDMTFTSLIDQNGSDSIGGVLVTNLVSPRLQLLSTIVVPLTSLPTNSYQVSITQNVAIVRFSVLPGYSQVQIVTLARPKFGGWFTNSYTISHGILIGSSCSQAAYIEGPSCTNTTLFVSLDRSNAVHISLSNGFGCAFQLQVSSDLVNWIDLFQIQPDRDPYDVPLGPPLNTCRFYRVRKLD